MVRKRTRIEQEALKRKVLASHTSGVPVAVFCERNKVASRTYYRYLDKVSKEIKENYLGKQDRLLTYFVESHNFRKRELMEKYKVSQSTYLLSEMRKADHEMFADLQSLGAIPKAETNLALIGGAEKDPMGEMISDAIKTLRQREGQPPSKS